MIRPVAGLVVTALLALAGIRSAARADVTLAPLFTDAAVLQRDKPVPLWGRADPGEKITLTFAGQKREATAGPDGRWLAILDPMPASAQGADLVVSGKNTLTLRDILVGEVWLCSGQSNMEWPVSRSDRAAQEIAAADFPQIRHIKIARVTAAVPAESVASTGWQAATPQTAGAFSAVAFFFARDIHQHLGVPVGLINASYGGTPIEAWMSPAALASNPAFRAVDERWQQTLAEFPAKKVQFDTALPEWTKAEAAAKAKGKPAYDAFLKTNPRPRAPVGGPDHPWAPRSLFNGMINPLLPSALRGVLWYQGENNVGQPGDYHALFSTLIGFWRAHLGQGDIPFFWVNLAAFRYPDDPTGLAAAVLREAQTKILALPATGQALAIDIGHPADIHPTNKQEVGRRLALLAKHRVYGAIGDDAGPTFAGATREGPALRVRFTHAGGLIAYHKPVQSLQLAGPDRVFHPAEAKIVGNTLLVTSRAVREPVAVRYAWSNAPEANLYNGAGLPAAPFRSDDW